MLKKKKLGLRRPWNDVGAFPELSPYGKKDNYELYQSYLEHYKVGLLLSQTFKLDYYHRLFPGMENVRNVLIESGKYDHEINRINEFDYENRHNLWNEWNINKNINGNESDSIETDINDNTNNMDNDFNENDLDNNNKYDVNGFTFVNTNNIDSDNDNENESEYDSGYDSNYDSEYESESDNENSDDNSTQGTTK